MSARWTAQSAEGIIQRIPGLGTLEYWSSKNTPTNAANPNGYAAGCRWIYSPVNGPPRIFENLGGNGYYVGNTQNTLANWVEVGADCTLYQTALAVASGISPSATGTLKLVDIYTLPAGILNAAGRTITFSVFCNNTGTSAHTTQIQIVANPTNTGLPSSGAGIAGKTDGTVTISTGTVILDTGNTYAPAGTVTFGFGMTGVLIKNGAAGSNTQESTITNIYPADTTTTHLSAWADRTLTESAAIVFAVVVAGQATADVVYQGCQISLT